MIEFLLIVLIGMIFWINHFNIALMLLVGYLLWFSLYGAECAINGASNHWKSFFEELTWFLPGGSHRKGNFIKERVDGFENGAMLGSSRTWDYKEIKENNLYEAAGNDMLPGRLHFLIMHCFIPLLPLGIYLLWQ